MRSVEVGVSTETPREAADTAVSALWELLTIAPLAAYSDRFCLMSMRAVAVGPTA